MLKKSVNRIKRKKDSKGLSTIVATLLIILLTLVAVGIIWVVVRNVINSGSEQISLGKFTLNLKIAQVQDIDDSNVNVTIKRNSGPGDFVGLAFIVEDDKGTTTIKKNVSLSELQSQRFQLNFSSGFNASKIKKISIAPIFILKSGKESIGDIKDVYVRNVDGNLIPVATCVPACVSPYVCSGTTCVDGTTCTDSCSSLHIQCGTHIICGLSTSCQNMCTTSQTCTNGICTRVPACGDGIIDLGEACDDNNNANGDGCSSTCVVEQGYSCTSANPSVCTACAINNIYWLPNLGIQNGNSVLLDIGVNSACNGKSFTFDIRKKNLITDSTVATINSVFASSTDAASNWVVNILAGGEGNYYLRATLDEKNSVTRDSSNVAITIPTSAQCGLYGCQASIGENCITCASDCGCTSPNVCNSSGICEIPCDLTNAHWNTTTAISGDPVSLIVSGSNCNGKLITFEIRKDNSIGTDYVTNPSSRTLLSGSATTSWTSVAPFLGDTTPTYYFIASVSGSSETIDSRSTSTSLDVSVISCGDGRCNGAETCSTCAGDCGSCCGNNVINSPEQCDGSQLGGATCTSVRGTSWTGTLSCTAGCLFNTGLCTCTAETNPVFCTRLNKNCGSVTANDNCGVSRTVASCGSCTLPATCNATNMCSCVTESDSTFCSRLNKNCGSVTANDNCGVSRTVASCGSCTLPATCNATNMCATSTGTCGGVTCATGEYCFNNQVCLLDVGTHHTYFVALNGNDNNPGTFASPFYSWQRGVLAAQPGDIVYIRGGTWQPTTHILGELTPIGMLIDPVGYHQGASGTAAAPIRYYNYPGEKPILDGSLVGPDADRWISGIYIGGAEYIYLKGLTISNIHQSPPDNNAATNHGKNFSEAYGIGSFGANIHYENMVVHDIDGRGFQHWGGAWTAADAQYAYDLCLQDPTATCVYETPLFTSDNTSWINCDSYNLYDHYAFEPGNAADGWKVEGYAGNYFYWEGDRAWNYSDDGIDPSGFEYRHIKNCWLMSTDYYQNIYDRGLVTWNPEGNGIKMTGGKNNTVLVENCIATNCVGSGFVNNIDVNYAGAFPNGGIFYNNLAYRNDIGYTDVGNLSKYKNNIVYASQQTSVVGGKLELDVSRTWHTGSNNTWIFFDPTILGGPDASWPWYEYNPAYTVTNADFVSLDYWQLLSPRSANGSLPTNITFGHLAAGSDLINRGTNVGIPYSGSAPDLGPFESSY